MFVLDRNRYYRYYIINLYYQHSKICSSFNRFCVMIVCMQVTSNMLNKRTKITFEVTEILHKTFRERKDYSRYEAIATRMVNSIWMNML